MTVTSVSEIMLPAHVHLVHLFDHLVQLVTEPDEAAGEPFEPDSIKQINPARETKFSRLKIED